MKRLLLIGPIAALAVAGCGSSADTGKSTPNPQSPTRTASSGVEKDAVTLDDFSINPAVTALKAGKIEFKVKNSGKTNHEFVVIDTSKKAARLGQGSHVPERGNIGETGNVAPGHSKTLVINLRKGHYAVICNDPGHYSAGMHKDLYVN